MSDLLHSAVRNNAEWCHLICRSHGAEGRFDADAWICSDPAPRFYPNVVTLRPDHQAAQVEAIGQLSHLSHLSHLPDGWGVKDSFNHLDLAPLGFRAAIHGRWVRYSEGPTSDAGLEWRRVATIDDLAQWEVVWGGADHYGQDRIFLPVILSDPSVQLFGGYADGRLEAGGIVNHAAGVTGLSNTFASRPELIGDVVRRAHSLAGGAPLVGWEAEGDVAEGETLGLLQVWLRQAP